MASLSKIFLNSTLSDSPAWMTDCISRLSEGISNFLLFQPPDPPSRLSQFIIPLCKSRNESDCSPQHQGRTPLQAHRQYLSLKDETLTYIIHNQPHKVLYSFYLLYLLKWEQVASQEPNASSRLQAS